MQLLLSLVLVAGAVLATEEEFTYGTSHYNNTMKWGSYRPQVIFGMKTRSDESLITGLMWHRAEDPSNIRHASEMNEQFSYGWNRHDGVNFGSQVVHDRANQLIMDTEFIKDTKNSKDGGDWTVRITGKFKKNHPNENNQHPWISLYFYVGSEQVRIKDEIFRLSGIQTGSTRKKGVEIPIIRGKQPSVNDFYMNVHAESATSEETKSNEFHFWGSNQEHDKIWKVKDFVFEELKKDYHDQMQQWTREKTDEQLKTMQRPKIYTTLPNVIDHDSNLFVIQKIVQAPFTFDVVFLSEEKNQDVVNNNQIKKASAQAREQFTEKINTHKKEFESKFNNTFHSAEHAFSRDQLEMGAFAISNMVGGIGYFYGTSVHQKHSMVDDSAIGEPYKVAPYALFTGVPARSFFPRGFLWDEGFHELLIQRWNKEISKDIIAHWFNSMREEGWIPREQILGDEAKSRVPEQFQTQHDSHANPPTMFISVLHMARTVLSQISVDETGKQSAFTGADAEYLKTLYPLLRKNYDWYLKTQAGIKAETYRWRGRTPGHTLSSGLDDYPRGTDVPNRDERHLDLHCWVFMMTDTLNRIKQIIDGHGDPTLEKKLETLRKNLDEYHWNDQIGWYSDYAGKSVNNTRPEYSPHVGYVSLFPLFFVNQQGKNTPKFQQGLKKAYELLHNADGMWSPYGILSLSKMDVEFGTKENYWRGPIWLNINYLTLRSLYENRDQKVEGVNVGEVYQALRQNLINTLSTEWHRSRTLYEQYNPITGRGQKAFPFTGWTSLIVLMMGELY